MSWSSPYEISIVCCDQVDVCGYMTSDWSKHRPWRRLSPARPLLILHWSTHSCEWASCRSLSIDALPFRRRAQAITNKAEGRQVKPDERFNHRTLNRDLEVLCVNIAKGATSLLPPVSSSRARWSRQAAASPIHLWPPRAPPLWADHRTPGKRLGLSSLQSTCPRCPPAWGRAPGARALVQRRPGCACSAWRSAGAASARSRRNPRKSQRRVTAVCRAWDLD